MQNISEPKFFVGVVLLLFLGMVGLPGVFAENPLENLGQAIVEKYEETSKPLFETEEPPVKEKLKDDPFFDKIRKKHAKFTEEERSRRRAFRKKIRAKDWPAEKRQEELAEFQKKQLARRKKFIDKQQNKIRKHQEEGS